jgi:Holliday junction resolvase-like predicted endonuclease
MKTLAVVEICAQRGIQIVTSCFRCKLGEIAL